MKLEKITMLFGAVIILLLAFLIVWKADIVGVSGGRLEQDARESQNINGDWEVAKAINDDICAMLFFDEEKENYTYTIYLSKNGFSYGYFFRQGGQDAYMKDGVKGVVFEDKGIALLSLNQEGVCKVEVEGETKNQTIQVDPDKPFVLVLPIDCGEITMYDAREQIVTLYDTFTGA